MPYTEFRFESAAPSHMHRVFWPAVLALSGPVTRGMRVLDAGCGNGATGAEYIKLGCAVVGVDLSVSGVEIARQAHPAARFEVIELDAGVLGRLNESPFDLVVSTEVIEHLYDPRAYVRGCFAALRSPGRLVVTTPYHGYFKNLAISVMGRWDSHADPLWDGGHIKLWSKATLTRLLHEAGFVNLRFRGAGRLPWLWKTMVVSADKR
jgi:2-polyprenyl-3-methyl-5-hydroxy-6-metoxy-1,4-benzoquinol methylase